jgi:hypothetical protein
MNLFITPFIAYSQGEYMFARTVPVAFKKRRTVPHSIKETT